VKGQRPLQIDARAIEVLLAAHTPDELDRALVDVICDCGVAPAAAIWRKLTDEDGAWRELRSRGSPELLPSRTFVQAVLQAGLDDRAPNGGHVLSACVGERCVALVLGPTPRDDDAELASALLGLHSTLVAAACGAKPPQDPFGAPLPGKRDDPFARDA
jgi:hypothetical protein